MSSAGDSVSRELLHLARELSTPPPCFERRGTLFWRQEWSSRKALNVQLDHSKGEGARSREIAEAQTDAIIELLGESPKRLLDLGCGPGYHLAAFASRGAFATGLDVSPAAIRWAREVHGTLDSQSASKVEIVEGDMLATPWEEQRYDLITLLFGEYGLLVPSERRVLLQKVGRSLRSGGHLILELFSQPVDEVVEEKSWEYVEEDGFWSGEPYLELTTTVCYQEEQAVLHRFWLITESEERREERIWECSMDEPLIGREARESGLSVVRILWDHPLFDGGKEEEGRRWFLTVLRKEG